MGDLNLGACCLGLGWSGGEELLRRVLGGLDARPDDSKGERFVRPSATARGEPRVRESGGDSWGSWPFVRGDEPCFEPWETRRMPSGRPAAMTLRRCWCTAAHTGPSKMGGDLWAEAEEATTMRYGGPAVERSSSWRMSFCSLHC